MRDRIGICFGLILLLESFAAAAGIDIDIPMIVIMGRGGVGKSTFIDQLGGRHYSKGHRPKIDHRMERGSPSNPPCIMVSILTTK